MTQHVRVAILGAGFAGLGAAIRLLQERRHDLLVFERADEVGGVWRDNTYPGCACDVESHLYSFSFAPNPNWSHSYSPQAEIQRYLQDCVERFGVRPHLRLGHAVSSASWDERAQHWVVETSRGTYTADVLVGAVGALSEPSVPDIPGLEHFQGARFHSSRWDHAVDLRGKRVGVIGTGASAAQFIPEIQPDASRLTVFQRTPPWVVPRNDVAFGEAYKAAMAHVPGARSLVRGAIYLRRELFGTMFLRPELGGLIEALAGFNLRTQVTEPVLRDKLTPRYRMGCKRVIVSDDYLRSLTQPNVEVETTGIETVTERGVRTTDGREHLLDALILGTGFQVTEMPFARHLRGRGGKTLREAWGVGMRAYLGTTIPEFPNFFIVPGPNTGLGHSSMILMIEAQVEHLLAALDHLDATGACSLAPSHEAEARYVAAVDEGLARTVWATGCRSWYLDAKGRNSTLWPGYTFSFMKRARRFEPKDYVLEHRRNDTVRLPFASRLESLAGRALTHLPARLLAPRPVVRDGLTLEPEVQAILAVREVTGSLPLTGTSIVASRERLRRDAVTGAGTPVKVGRVTELDLPGTLRARHYAPEGGDGAPLVVFYHGGGFVLGDLESHDAPCRLLCHEACAHVLSIDYRLAPEHRHPAAVEDAVAAYRWARENAEHLGADPSRIAVAGDSAGGNLAAVVAQECRRQGLPRPALQVLVYPATDRTRSYPSTETFGRGFMLEASDMDWFAKQYRGERFGVPDVTADPGLERDLTGLAPALVVTAGFDPLRDEGEDYARRLSAAGVPTELVRFDGHVHGFLHMLGVSRAARRAVESIARDTRRLLAETSGSEREADA
jgi:cation diffusion facilitator CzcD-associated flavoprotein CzcO/acetyl esterase/lipase